jgi:hypothetical protein
VNGEQNDHHDFKVSGAVYGFTRENGQWRQHAFIKATNTGEGDHFGHALSLSLDGKTLAVSAPDEDGKEPAICASGSGDCTAQVNGEGEGWEQDFGAVYLY